jgi:hypothetical protein
MESDEPTGKSAVAPVTESAPWWRDAVDFTKVAALLTSVITALAGLGTVGTNYLVEKTKLRAQAESLDAKRFSDSEDRKDKNVAAERELRTKYVDLALEPALGIDHRARIFGYLSTVLENPTQRDWATKEAKKAEEQRVYLSQLKAQLEQATKNHSSSTQRYLEALGSSGGTDAVKKILQARYENEEDEIKALKSIILGLEGRETDLVPQTSEVAARIAKP